MNKLQLYITKSFDGYKVLFNINPSEEVKRHVTELRDLVGKVTYDASEKNIFHYVTTVDTGIFVTIVRTIPSQPGDHLAAWIYIPAEVVIDGETLERVLNVTARKVSGDRVTTDDVSALRELFAAEYADNTEAPAIIESDRNAALAWRRYNGNSGQTFRTLLDKGLFQLQYLDYCGVMFINEDLGITVEGDDLTETPLNEPAVILPVPKTPEQFGAHVFGRPVTGPLRATMNTNLVVVWKHQGFEDVICQEVITQPNFSPTPPDTSESRKSISAASFSIAAQSGKVPTEECRITVNGIDITEQPHLFTPAELSSAMVVINCPGFAPYNAKLDLASSTKALVRLQERTKVFCFEMPVISAELGGPVRFKIYSKKAIDESPLEGYVTIDENIQEGESRTNHLMYVGSATRNSRKALYIGIGLVVGLVIGWLTRCSGGPKAPVHIDTVPPALAEEKVSVEDHTLLIQPVEENRTVESQPDATENVAAATTTGTQEKAVNTSKVTPEAIEYLDNNKTWDKESLEKHPCLQGLYDDMNNFRLEKLAGQWGDKLSASKTFQRVVRHSVYGMQPKKKAKSGIEGTTYSTGNDTRITVQTYLNRIDP